MSQFIQPLLQCTLYAQYGGNNFFIFSFITLKVDEMLERPTCKIYTGHSLGGLLSSLASTQSHGVAPAIAFASPGAYLTAQWLKYFITTRHFKFRHCYTII